MTKELFKGSVVLNPVPAVVITSRNKDGVNNAFTVAWTGTICTNPPMLSISIRPERLSYEYIKETMEFTVNLPNTFQVRETDYCGVISGRDVDKIKHLGLTAKPGEHVNSPYLEEFPINIECKVKQIIPLGTHDLFLAEVVGSHINKNIIDEKGKIHFEWANLINYCHGEYFPMSKKPIGQFGFSVAKNPLLIEKYKHIKSYTEYRDEKNNKKPKKKVKSKVKKKK
ncbi:MULTISPECIES: flavin reductase family protein [Cetobacterium]|uniref:flavin reductase family protein n=1 Tax=Cetobacterium TaxID=180162 RepID=UPI00163BD1FB|nr:MULTISPECIES: flavin reductase family protein [Cetobacterium]MBC2854787.1 flavin reductase family protein [Cetobacterium sp. 2G large]MCQ9627683.1 flavin reductase family protein [Cetobacterium somerae]MCX3066474.1 flavin reductase family protein [Cetobacterium somerae]UPO98265.1 flavin reductase family protein [Cetobacterium somerae]WVJ02522.1 flavin reductase family protein [Cetobacterium somerae]